MNIGILIFSEPKIDTFSGTDKLAETGEEMGHTIHKLYEPYFSFVNGEIFYEGEPLPKLDVIISRPNFITEPGLHTYVVQLLESAGYLIINSHIGYTWAKNKLDQHVLFDLHNLPCPNWGIAKTTQKALAVAEKISYPVVLKVPFGTHGKGVFFAENKKTLAPLTDYLTVRDGNPLIIEEFIQEANFTDLRVFIIGGTIVGAMQRTAKSDDIRANASNGGTGSTVELTEEEKELAIRAANLFHLEIAGVDLIRSKEGPLIIEINGNPGFRELERVTEIPIREKMIEYAVQKADTREA